MCEHQHNYTCLHFAGLSGKVDVCHLLLLAGAKTNITNTVGRTPSQMAAFVGNHSCVATINNFVPKSVIDYYTVGQGQQTKPQLPSFIAESLHKFIMEVNIHPVRIALNLQNYVGLLDHLKEVKTVLELLEEKEMKSKECNEVMAFKFHYMSFVVNELIKLKARNENDDKKCDIVDTLTKKLLKPNKEGNLEFMDLFLKESVREFPYRESTLFRQIVTTLAANDAPFALGVISSAINGQRGFVDNITTCCTCGQEKPAKKCSKCKVAQYCDRNCQRLHWFVHKKACSSLNQSANAEPAEKHVDVNEISSEIQNLLLQQN